MDPVKWLLDLFRHMKWAEGKVWSSVFALPRAAADPRLLTPLVDFIAWVWSGKAAAHWPQDAEQAD